MSDLFIDFLRVLVSLAIVLVLILLVLPYLLPLLQRLKLAGKGEGSKVKLIRLIPVGRSFYIVELEVNGRLFVVAMTEGAVEVLYRDEEGASD